jgi:hypothetical protein
MAQIAPASTNPLAREKKPQFVLRIALGLVLLLATRDVLSLFPTVSDVARQIIMGVVAVGLPATVLYFFEVRRRA